MFARNWVRHVAVCALVACITPATVAFAEGPRKMPDGDVDPPGAASAELIAEGAYKCQFKQGNFRYAKFRCAITKANTAQGHVRIRLEKLTGSQRIRGTVRPTEKGFVFAGEYFCPKGACTQDVSGEFVRTGRHSYEGTLNSAHEPTLVKLWK